MDVITFAELRKGDTIEVEDNGKTYPGKVVAANTDKPFAEVSVKVGLLTYGYDHEADDAVILLDRAVDTDPQA